MRTITESSFQGREKQNTGKAIAGKCSTLKHKHTELQTSDKIYIAPLLHIWILVAPPKGFQRPIRALGLLFTVEDHKPDF